MNLPREIWQMILNINRQDNWIKRKQLIHNRLSKVLFRSVCTQFVYRSTFITFYRSEKVELTIVTSDIIIEFYFVIYTTFVGRYSTKEICHTQPKFDLK